jgi:hypothetical protein
MHHPLVGRHQESIRPWLFSEVCLDAFRFSPRFRPSSGNPLGEEEKVNLSLQRRTRRFVTKPDESKRTESELPSASAHLSKARASQRRLLSLPSDVPERDWGTPGDLTSRCPNLLPIGPLFLADRFKPSKPAIKSLKIGNSACIPSSVEMYAGSAVRSVFPGPLHSKIYS